MKIGAFRFLSMFNILALQISLPYVITTQNGTQEQIGYRPILDVQSILANVQTTVLFGNDLYGITLMSNLSADTIFKQFVGSYANRLETWVQLNSVPNPPIPYPNQQMTMRPYSPPVAAGKIQVLSAGWNGAQGYWVEFLGNYFLGFPLFKNFHSVTRGGPNYKGFQPSNFNAGNTGNSGGSSSGGNFDPGC